jgi:hypothetical protein
MPFSLGVRRISQLVIDEDKDFSGRALLNVRLSNPIFSGTVLGSPVWASAQAFPSPLIGGRLVLSDTGLTLPRTFTFPDFADTVVTLTAAQNLSNKTISDPVLSGTITGTYTLGGTPTLASDLAFSGTRTLGGVLSVDPVNLRVGIGTSAPGARLYVKTTDTTTVPFQVEAPVDLMPGWSYRRPITIYNTGSALTNYQVLVTLDTQSLITAGKMRTDCGDIRFTDSNGSTLLNYWIESGLNTASTKIWVKVPSIPANSTKTIYVYYGNPSATSLSNGDNTFDFFDDFLGASMDANKWIHTYPEGITTVSGGKVELKVTGANAWRGEGWKSIYSSSDSYIVEMIVNPQTAASAFFGFFENAIYIEGSGTGVTGETTYFYCPVVSRTGDEGPGINERVRWRINGGALGYYNIGPYLTLNNWYRIKLEVIKADANTKTFKVYRENSLLHTASWSATGIGSATTSIYITVAAYEANTPILWWDLFFVRKYSSPEPTTSVGAEESPPRQQTVFYLQPQTGSVTIGTAAPEAGFRLDVVGSAIIRGDILPHADSYGNLGTDARRWARVRAGVVVHGQSIFSCDACPEHEPLYTMKEDHEFLYFLNRKGEVIMRLSQDGDLWIKGSVKKMAVELGIDSAGGGYGLQCGDKQV